MLSLPKSSGMEKAKGETTNGDARERCINQARGLQLRSPWKQPVHGTANVMAVHTRNPMPLTTSQTTPALNTMSITIAVSG